MALFENFPYTNLHNLNIDWIIQKIEKFSKDYENIDEYIQQAIDNYIETHPDYNIHDDSITSLKLNKYNIPFYNVTDYGIIPDSGDVYREVHSLFAEKVYNTGGIVFFPKGVYTISYTLFVPENTIVIGEGEETEIYFNEDDIAFGTAFGNAGSNIMICNMKIRQKSTGTFISANQPGCIGFTTMSKRQCLEPAYSHNFLYDDQNTIRNLYAVNIIFSGKYAIQTEPDANGIIENIVYENLIAEGAISVQVANSILNNISIKNCVCNVLRVQVGANSSGVRVENVITDSIAFANQTIPYVKNLIGTNKLKTSTIGYSGTKYTVSGSAVFEDCVFNENSEYEYGFIFLEGIQTFNNCKLFFENTTQLIRRDNAVTDTDNYLVMNDCVVKGKTNGTLSKLIGYGKNNIVSGNVKKLLFGDLDVQKNLAEGIAGTFVNRLYGNGDRIVIKIGSVIADEAFFTLNTGFDLPVADDDLFFVHLWSSSSPASVNHTAWGKIVQKQLKITEYWTRQNLSTFDVGIVNHTIQLARIPTPAEIASTLD